MYLLHCIVYGYSCNADLPNSLYKPIYLTTNNLYSYSFETLLEQHDTLSLATFKNTTNRNKQLNNIIKRSFINHYKSALIQLSMIESLIEL